MGTDHIWGCDALVCELACGHLVSGKRSRSAEGSSLIPSALQDYHLIIGIQNAHDSAQLPHFYKSILQR